MVEDYLGLPQPTLEKRKYRRVRLITEVLCAAPGREEALVTQDIGLGGPGGFHLNALSCQC
jgi:hypothetical protein